MNKARDLHGVMMEQKLLEYKLIQVHKHVPKPGY